MNYSRKNRRMSGISGILFAAKRNKKRLLMVNIVFLFVLITIVMVLHTDRREEKKATIVKVEETEPFSMKDAEDSMVSIYGKLLPGAKATLDDGNKMSFGFDGAYSGFFDSKNPEVTGTYTLATPDDKSYLANVNIYNEDSTRVVQYYLMYDDNHDFELYYPAIDLRIPLKY